MQEKSERTIQFLERLDRLRLSNQWTSGEAAKAVGLSRTMLHYLRSGRNSVTDKVLYRLAEAEKMKPVQKNKAQLFVDSLLSSIREANIKITSEDQDRGYITVKLQYLRGEPPPGYPTEAKVTRPDHTMHAQLMAYALLEEYHKVLLECLPRSLGTKEFLNLLTPFCLEALEDGAMSMVFGLRWRQRVQPVP